MLAATYFLPQIDMRWLYALLAAPVVGQLLVGGLIIAAFAFVTKPK